MASSKEIKDRIGSIQDTMKITNAMYLISSSKMKKAKKNLADTEPYFFGIQDVAKRILRHAPDLENIYFDQRMNIRDEERKIGYIVITADKGLAGSYNHNVIKTVLEQYKIRKTKKNSLFVLGEYGRHYFEKKGYIIDHLFHYTVQSPTMHRARVIAEKMVDLYLNYNLDEIYLIFTKMINALHSETQVLPLLPQKKYSFSEESTDNLREESFFYPNPDSVMNSIIPDYISGVIFGALVEAYTSEQNARMIAMEAATRNANEMLKELSIKYNRARQAAITQEVTEVVSGAKTKNRKK
ncbi:ATP synthase F1 subunit gamma [Anaerosacchariphilus polymeriproducens]|uniref:ATP synthase gamma chain n=1 Tax=Anaerosacchariphilus polymeriproducens TaxID=1812858 RepID=A0A371AZ01_9FIRM|nr:ATP synthase F1 subunit gamma [Anaerosacchariphilus polymeriproducens]RDU24825.1 ATP synthase F1 subunit gamma [Anaerosacchariphilus polymeriproducens]